MKKNWDKKMSGIIAGTSILALVLAGCGQQNNPATEVATDAAVNTEKESASDAEEKIADGLSGDITIWSWTAEQIQASIVPEFNKKYPDINVEVVNLPSGDLKTKLMASLAAGSGGPDICQIQFDDTAQYIANGGLSDMSKYMNPIKGDFPEFQIAMLSEGDAIYGTPIDAGPCGIFYREDLLEKAGITQAPATMEEFFAAGEALKKIGVYLHRMPSTGDTELLRMMVQQQGGSYFDADGNPSLDTPEFRNAVDFQIKLFESGYALDVKNWSPAYDAEMQGDQLATHMGAAWYMNTFINQWPEAAETWKIAPMPQFDTSQNASCNNGGSALAIPEESDNKDAAWAFIEFYCASTEGRLIAARDMGEFASYLPVYEDPEMADKTEKNFGDQKVYSFFREELTKVPSDFRLPAAYGELNELIGSELGRVVSGEITLDDYVSSMQKAAESIVDKY